jgi:hypothetical protein
MSDGKSRVFLFKDSDPAVQQWSLNRNEEERIGSLLALRARGVGGPFAR